MAAAGLNEPFPKKSDPSEDEDIKYLIVADDNQGDWVLLKKALEENNIREKFRFVRNGLELVELLEQCKTTRIYPGSPFPCLILLDLYMPRVDGHEALRIIKSDKQLRKIPVIVLTTSHAHDDVTLSYHNGANSFLVKPLEYAELVQLIGLVKRYWLEEARLPV